MVAVSSIRVRTAHGNSFDHVVGAGNERRATVMPRAWAALRLMTRLILGKERRPGMAPVHWASGSDGETAQKNLRVSGGIALTYSCCELRRTPLQNHLERSACRIAAPLAKRKHSLPN